MVTGLDELGLLRTFQGGAREMRLIRFVLLLSALGGAAAWGSHSSNLGTVDTIDHVFPAGGGLTVASLSSVSDDGWMVFDAVVGDTVTVVFSESNGNFYDGLILREVTNGIVEVGDVVGVTNFNIDQTGSGTDLQIIHPPSACSLNSYEWGASSGPNTCMVSIPATGQYAIGVTAANESIFGGAQTFSVTLSGNSGGTPAVTPTPTVTNTPTPTVTNTPTPTVAPTLGVGVPEIPTLSGSGMALLIVVLMGIAVVCLMRVRG